MEQKKLLVLVKSFLLAIPLWLFIVSIFAGLSTDFELDRFMALGSMPETWFAATSAFFPVFALILLGAIAAYRENSSINDDVEAVFQG